MPWESWRALAWEQALSSVDVANVDNLIAEYTDCLTVQTVGSI